MRIKHFLLVIYCGFILRIVLAIYNSYWGPIPGAEFDAQTFFNQAVDISKNLHFKHFAIGPNSYLNILGFVFHFTIPSLLLASLFSCFAWLWSSHIVLKILQLIGASSKMKLKASILYALYPSSVLYTSITLREPFQLLFFTLSIYFALKIYYGRDNFNFFNLLITVSCMGILHGAMLITGIMILIGSLILYLIREHTTLPYHKLLLFSLFAIPILIFLSPFISQISYDLSNGIIKAAETYQINLIKDAEGRTNYKLMDDLTNNSGLFQFMFYGFFQYLFAPLPWQISHYLDIIIMFEGFMRFYLLWLTYKNFKNRSGRKNFGWIFIFFIFLLNEFIWSLGSVNWGTAMRHHVPAFFCLLITAFSVPNNLKKLDVNKNGKA